MPALPSPAPLRDALGPRLGRIARERPAQALVENRIVFGAERAEFAVYDTFRPAERVPLRAANPLYCGMVTGKKVVHAPSGEAIPFLPEESLVVPSGQTVFIDFPGASDEAPTKCLTIEIDRARVRSIVDRLNEAAPRSPDSGEWVYEDAACCHFTNTPGIARTVSKLASVFTEDHPDRDLLIDFGVQELIVRMLRVEARRLLLAGSAERAAQHGLAAAVEFAKAHLGRPLTVADLAQVACMSEPSFYRAFRAELGLTPLAFLTGLRMRRAERLLADPARTVSDVAAAVGFSSPSHFIRIFRQHAGMTPKQFQLARRRAAV
ncbi:MAG: helix-turn-helix domain-containing protein [Rubricoccaceae bacterium]